MPTPHIEAKPGDFADTCLLPGDPLRAKFIADTFLDDVRQVNGIRNMLGFTGSYQGVPVSVMGSGMGIPSISIYAKELITEYGVKNLIRVGSCGAVSSKVEVRDIVLGSGACTDSVVNRTRFGGMDFAAVADFGLLRGAVEAAERLDLKVRVGNLFFTVFLLKGICIVSVIFASSGSAPNATASQSVFVTILSSAPPICLMSSVVIGSLNSSSKTAFPYAVILPSNIAE